jgi:hypothetical protein
MRNAEANNIQEGGARFKATVGLREEKSVKVMLIILIIKIKASNLASSQILRYKVLPMNLKINYLLFILCY